MEIRSWHFFEWIYFFRSVYDIERVVYTLLEYDTVFWNYLKSSEIFWWRSTKRSLQFAFARLGKLSPTSYAYCHYQVCMCMYVVTMHNSCSILNWEKAIQIAFSKTDAIEECKDIRASSVGVPISRWIACWMPYQVAMTKRNLYSALIFPTAKRRYKDKAHFGVGT